MKGGGNMVKTHNWLILIYKIPPEPSRYRVALWRRLKGVGAVYLQNSVCILPDVQANRELFKELCGEVEEAGGESVLLRAEAFEPSEQDKVIERLNSERNDEYGEFIGQCNAFLEEIRSETEKQNFSFGELEENEEELKRLEGWLEKIQGRDYFGAVKGGEAKEYLSKTVEALEAFSKRVFAANEV